MHLFRSGKENRKNITQCRKFVTIYCLWAQNPAIRQSPPPHPTSAPCLPPVRNQCSCGVTPVVVRVNIGRGSVGYRSWFGRTTTDVPPPWHRFRVARTAVMHCGNGCCTEARPLFPAVKLCKIPRQTGQYNCKKTYICNHIDGILPHK